MEHTILPDDMDAECIELCNALNTYPGIATTSSCCGHGVQPYRIWFYAESLESLPPVLYYFHWCHCGCSGWNVIARTDCAMSPVQFMIEGPAGDAGYKAAVKIAHLLETARVA